MRSGCEPDVSGANDPAPAEDLLNENPSLVALGKTRKMVRILLSDTQESTVKKLFFDGSVPPRKICF